MVLNGQAEMLWSSNVSNSVTNSSATLGDFRNLVLQVDTKDWYYGKVFNILLIPSCQG